MLPGRQTLSMPIWEEKCNNLKCLLSSPISPAFVLCTVIVFAFFHTEITFPVDLVVILFFS